jgi:hypothetical protein
MITADRDISMVEMSWKCLKSDCTSTFSDASRQADYSTVELMNDGTSFQDIRIFHLYASEE